MKYLLFIFSLFPVAELIAQWQDDFNDADLSSPVTWFGDLDSFEIANQKLWLNAPANTQESYLVTQSQASFNGYWQFDVMLEFNPSTSNKALIYLTSNTDNLKSSLNGYYVQVGGSEDDVSLFKQNGNQKTLLIDGVNNITDTTLVALTVKIERNSMGLWMLSVASSANPTNFQLQGTTFDNTFMTSAYAGVLCDYTATRSDKFFFDNFIVTCQPYQDYFPPKLIQTNLINPNLLQFIFNEPIQISNTMNTEISVTNNAISNFDIENQTIFIELENPFIRNQPYQIDISALSDTANNFIDTTFTLAFNNIYHWQEININEIYADESPSYGLPNGEFIELYNNTPDTILLNNWSLADQLDTAVIINGILLPHHFVILCAPSDSIAYASYGNTIPLYGMPGWNNNEDYIYLIDNFSQTIDSIHYNDTWYRNAVTDSNVLKSDGGFTLEKHFASSSCSNSYFWGPSAASAGGTPGFTNSLPSYDISPPSNPIAFAAAFPNNTILLQLKEEIQLTANSDYILTNTKTANNIHLNLLNDAFPNSTLHFSFNTTVDSETEYLLQVNNALDCYGNAITISTPIFLIDTSVIPNIAINEILFNPFTGGSDFVELFNRSNQAILLSGIQIVKFDYYSQEERIDSVSLHKQILPPSTYAAFTEDSNNITTSYIVEHPSQLYQVDLPNFPDDRGCIGLVLFDTIILDKLCYNKNWHHELLTDENGVSLEKINPFQVENTSNNWYSAATNGTPTYKNSQFYMTTTKNSTLHVQPELFTPNLDGENDFTTIEFSSITTNNIVNTTIFDMNGRLIRTIASNQLVGEKASWIWDGAMDSGGIAAIGFYVVELQRMDNDGNMIKLYETIVLGGKI